MKNNPSTPHESDKIQIVLNVSQDTFKILDTLRIETKAPDVGSVLGAAVLVYNTLQKEVKDNFKIQAVKRTGSKQVIKEFTIP